MKCSSGSRSPRAGFGGDRHGPARSGHMCWGKAEGDGGQLGLAHPAPAGRMQQPGGAQKEGWQTHTGMDLAAFPPAQLSKELKARPRGGGWGWLLKPPGWTFKPSWTLPQSPCPRPCWARELGQPCFRSTKAQPPAAPKKVTPPGALRSSHLFPQLSRSPLSPPLSYHVLRLGDASGAFVPSPYLAPAKQPCASSLRLFSTL